MRRAAFVPLAAAALSLLAGRARADGGGFFFIPTEYRTAPDDGTRFRVTFDPGSRVWIGGGAAMLRVPAGPVAAPEVDAGIAYRSVTESGEGPECVAWQIDQRVLAGYVVPRAGVGGGAPPMDAALYAVSALRHDASPRIVLPTSPPRSIPFPFDVGFVSEVGRVTIADRPPRCGATACRPCAWAW